MSHPIYLWLSLFGAGLLVSCAAPRALVLVDSQSRRVPTDAVTIEPAVTPPIGHLRDGIRIPSMTEMPADSELRSIRPPSRVDGAGGVIARPPADPVSSQE